MKFTVFASTSLESAEYVETFTDFNEAMAFAIELDKTVSNYIPWVERENGLRHFTDGRGQGFKVYGLKILNATNLKEIRASETFREVA